MKKATFAPRSRNRRKCNQTGVIIKNSKKYAFAYNNRERNQQKAKEKNEMAKRNTSPQKGRSYWSVQYGRFVSY